MLLSFEHLRILNENLAKCKLYISVKQIQSKLNFEYLRIIKENLSFT